LGPEKPKERDQCPLVSVKVIEGVFNEQQKNKILADITNAMVAIEGERMRQVTLIFIEEIKKRQLCNRRQAIVDS
jgi:phenylpyruvate tautomerase PptA (4-oxalocrotonate tautomerase family)